MSNSNEYQTNTFASTAGSNLFEQAWLSPQPKAKVVLVHGLGEYAGRYTHVADALNQKGITVYAYDHLGHGKSDGARAYMPSIDILRDDLVQFIEKISKISPELPLFAIGHSMGGCVLAYSLVTRTLPLKGAILSAAALKPGDDISPFLVKISSVLGAILPKLPTVKLDPTAISRDEEVVKNYEADPLIFHDKLPARTGAQMIKAMKTIMQKAAAIQLPILVLHGTADRLTNVEGSKAFFANVTSKDKQLKLYENLYHEIMNEPEKEQVIADISDWLEKHL